MRLRDYAGVLIAAGALACADAPTMVSTPAATLQQPATRSVNYDAIGCAVAGAQGGVIAAARIPRGALPFSVPAIARAPGRASERRVLYVVAAPIAANKDGEALSLSCLLPTNSPAVLQAVIERGGIKLRSDLQRRLARADSTFPATSPLVAASSLTLMSPVYNALGQRSVTFVKNGQPAAFSVFAPSRAAHDWSCEPYCVNQGQLPTVNVSEYGNTYTYDFSHLMWDLGFWYDFPGQFSVVHYYGDCADASEKWIADHDQLNNLLADSSQFEAALSNVVSVTCQRRVDSKTKCIDLYISSKKSLLVGYGDNRDSDPNATYKMSRVQMYVDFDGLHGVAYINSSTIGWGPFSYTTPPSPHDPKNFILTRLAPDTVLVEFSFYNGFCQYVPGYPNETACPAINGMIKFGKTQSGSWLPTDVNRDQFPTLDVFQQGPDGNFYREVHYPESGDITDLWSRHETLETWRSEMAKLPPWCQLQ
jgi:hypothetical protein